MLLVFVEHDELQNLEEQDKNCWQKKEHERKKKWKVNTKKLFLEKKKDMMFYRYLWLVLIEIYAVPLDCIKLGKKIQLKSMLCYIYKLWDALS